MLSIQMSSVHEIHARSFLCNVTCTSYLQMQTGLCGSRWRWKVSRTHTHTLTNAHTRRARLARSGSVPLMERPVNGALLRRFFVVCCLRLESDGVAAGRSERSRPDEKYSPTCRDLWFTPERVLALHQPRGLCSECSSRLECTLNQTCSWNIRLPALFSRSFSRTFPGLIKPVWPTERAPHQHVLTSNRSSVSDPAA